MTARRNGNGKAPDVNLDDILGDRAAVRTVRLGGRDYHFGPLSLVSAKHMELGDVEAALHSLLADDDEYEAFIRAVPATAIDQAIVSIYGITALGEAKSRPPGSARKGAASKPSKRTSRPAASPSKRS